MMSKIIIILMLLAMMTSEADAQVTNDNTFNYEVQYHNLCAFVGQEVGNEEWTFTMKYYNQNTHSGCFMETGINVDCAQLNNDLYNLDVFYVPDAVALSTIFFDSWEDDGAATCSFEDGSDDLFSELIVDLTLDGPGEPGPHQPIEIQETAFLTNAGTNTTAIVYSYNWRYSNGGGFSTPLLFNTLTSVGETKKHINSNLIKPVVANGQEGIHHAGLIYPNNVSGGGTRTAGEVYYRFFLPEAAYVTISTQNPSTQSNTFLQLYNSSLVLIDNDVCCINMKFLEAGNYNIRVDGFNGGGQFELSVKLEAFPPDNDECAGAATLIAGDTNTNFKNYTTALATNSGTLECSNGLSQSGDVWFKFVPVSPSGKITVAQNFSNINFDFEVREQNNSTSGTCSSPDFVGCGDAGGAGSPEVFTFSNFRVGNTYFVRVYNPSNFDGGAFTICYENDFCGEGYTGANTLKGDQTGNFTFNTELSISSKQVIGSSAQQVNVKYYAGPLNQSIELMSGFEVKENTIFTADFQGSCN